MRTFTTKDKSSSLTGWHDDFITGVLSGLDVSSFAAIAASLGASALTSGGDHQISSVVLLAHCVPAASTLYTSIIGIILGVSDCCGDGDWPALCGLGIGLVWLLVLFVVLSEYMGWMFVWMWIGLVLLGVGVGGGGAGEGS